MIVDPSPNPAPPPYTLDPPPGSGYIIGVDDRPPYLLTLRKESGSGTIKVPKRQCTPSTPPTAATAPTPATTAPASDGKSAVAGTAPMATAPMALACDECHEWLAPEDMVYTTFGSAALGPQAPRPRC